MKKLFCVGLIAFATISFIACSNKNNNESVKKDANLAVSENTLEENSNNENSQTTDTEKEDSKINIENKENIPEKNNENTKTEIKNEKSTEESKPILNPTIDTKPEHTDSEKPIIKPEPETSTPIPPKPKPEPPKPEPPKPESDINQTERVFNLYYKDVAQNDIVVNGGQIKTYGLGVADNIREILSTISNKFFNGQLLSLKTIENIGNKKIAVIDLVGNKWTNTFQGSAGASAAEYNLITNILQRDYNGYWIDGVRFTMNGEAIVDTGHLQQITGTIYR
ncbi:MAG: hypothetical protein ACRCYE_05155 [Sarcina sp.]